MEREILAVLIMLLVLVSLRRPSVNVTAVANPAPSRPTRRPNHMLLIAMIVIAVILVSLGDTSVSTGPQPMIPTDLSTIRPVKTENMSAHRPEQAHRSQRPLW